MAEKIRKPIPCPHCGRALTSAVRFTADFLLKKKFAKNLFALAERRGFVLTIIRLCGECAGKAQGCPVFGKSKQVAASVSAPVKPTKAQWKQEKDQRIAEAQAEGKLPSPKVKVEVKPAVPAKPVAPKVQLPQDFKCGGCSRQKPMAGSVIVAPKQIGRRCASCAPGAVRWALQMGWYVSEVALAVLPPKQDQQDKVAVAKA